MCFNSPPAIDGLSSVKPRRYLVSMCRSVMPHLISDKIFTSIYVSLNIPLLSVPPFCAEGLFGADFQGKVWKTFMVACQLPLNSSTVFSLTLCGCCAVIEIYTIKYLLFFLLTEGIKATWSIFVIGKFVIDR